MVHATTTLKIAAENNDGNRRFQRCRKLSAKLRFEAIYRSFTLQHIRNLRLIDLLSNDVLNFHVG
jgi:hypothetical protein